METVKEIGEILLLIIGWVVGIYIWGRVKNDRF